MCIRTTDDVGFDLRLAHARGIEERLIARFGRGQIFKDVVLKPGQDFIVEYSNDLMNWKELTAGTAATTTVDVMDETSADSPMRFYRVQLK